MATSAKVALELLKCDDESETCEIDFEAIDRASVGEVGDWVKKDNGTW